MLDMLKEVYLMREGIDLFNYSKNLDRDQEEVILSSGLLSALQSFTQETRESSIDFFASKDEIFIFDQFDRHKINIVVIFSNSMTQSVCREVVKRIKELIADVGILELPENQQLQTNDEEQLRDQIEHLALSFTDTEYLVKGASEIFNKNKFVKYLAIYDYRGDDLHFVDANQDQFIENENQLMRQRSFHRNILPFIKAIDMGLDFQLVEIETDNATIIIFKERTLLITSINQHEIDQVAPVHNVPFQIISKTTFDSFMNRFSGLRSITRWKIMNEDRLVSIRGETPNYQVEEITLKWMSSVKRLIQSYGGNTLSSMKIYVDNPNYTLVKFTRSHTRNETIIELNR